MEEKLTFGICFKYEIWTVITFGLLQLNIVYRIIYIILINYLYIYIYVDHVLYVYQTNYKGTHGLVFGDPLQ